MKKVLKPVLMTVIIMAALTGGVFFFLNRGGGISSEFEKRIAGEQSDQSEDRAYRYDMEKTSVELKLSGEDKNVLNFDSNNVYQVDTSQQARDRLDRVIKKTSATFDEPVIAANPFGTNANTFYFYFETKYRGMIRYTITVADESVPDHVRYVNEGYENNLSAKHEFVVGGLVPGMTNYIVLDVLDVTGAVRDSCTYKFTAPAAGTANRVSVTDGKSKEKLHNGLFFVFPSSDKSIYVYDNSGILRDCIVTESAHGSRIYQSGDSVIYQVSDTKLVKVSPLGQVTGSVEVSGYGAIRDFSYDGYDNAYCLVTKKKRDYLLSVSFQNGKTEQVCAFPKGLAAGSLTTPSNGSIYISCDKPSGIIRLDALTGKTTKVGFVLGKKKDWKSIGKKDKEYKKKVSEDSNVLQWSTKGIRLNRGDGILTGGKNTFSTYLVEKGVGTGLRFALDDEQKSTKIEQNFPTNEGGRCLCQSYGDHMLITNLDTGAYTEYDEEGKVTRTFSLGQPLASVSKLSLNDMCFYTGNG